MLVPASARCQNGSDLDVERKVRKVEIHGNHSYKSGDLKDLLRTRGKSFWKPWKKHPLRPDFLRADQTTLGLYYRQNGFLYSRIDSAAIRPIEKSDDVDVHFYLTEGPRVMVDSVRVEGIGPVPESKVRDALLLEKGSPLDFTRLQASRDSVTNVYADRGYIFAQVSDSLRVDSTRVTVLYQIVPGPQVLLGKTSVKGTRKTRPLYVSREMLLHEGDILRRKKLIWSQQRIYDSGLYSDVQMESSPMDSATHQSNLLISVREQKMGWVDAGIGYGTVDQLRLTGQWGQRNIFRSSMKFVTTARYGIQFKDDPFRVIAGDRRGDVTLTHPWPLGIRLQTTVGVYAEKEPVIQETDTAPIEAYGGSLVLASNYLRDTRTSVSYEIRHVTSDSNLVSASGVVPPDTSYTTNRIAFTGEHDTRINIFDPKQGDDVLGRVELVRSPSPDTRGFTSFNVQGTRYVPMPSRSILAFRLAGGFLEPWGSTAPDLPGEGGLPHELESIPPDERFRAGGASSVRGYLENELGTRAVTDSTGTKNEIRGGQVIILASAEVRFPLFWIISGAAFFDGGNVWERPEDIKPSKIFSFAGGAGYNDMRYSVGLGLRLGTPVGPFRLDYGWKVRSPRTPQEPDLSSRRGELHFSLGNPF